MHGIYEVLKRRVVKYFVLKDHLASHIKAFWRNGLTSCGIRTCII